jgi:hypothetical protein
MRDVYATLRDLVPTYVSEGAKVTFAWSDRADPIWSRAGRWVRAEAHTKMHLVVVSGRGDETRSREEHAINDALEPIAREIARLLDGDIAATTA